MTNKVSIFFLFVSREKQKAEVKDRRVLEILQAKDSKIETLEQVCIMFNRAVKKTSVIDTRFILPKMWK